MESSEYEAWLLSGSEGRLCCSIWRVSLSCSAIPCLARRHDCVQQNAGLRHRSQTLSGKNIRMSCHVEALTKDWLPCLGGLSLFAL